MERTRRTGFHMSALRKSAKGQRCTVRIAGVCNHDPETVVLAHLNGGGMGRKRPDLHGAFCCSSCHDVVDGRVPSDFSRWELDLAHLQGVIRTQEWWLENGYL